MAAMIKKIGVIGSGQMGSGIAHVAALAGFDVVLNDVSADRLKSGMATINGNLSRQVAKNVIGEDARNQALKRIVSTRRWTGLPIATWSLRARSKKRRSSARFSTTSAPC